MSNKSSTNTPDLGSFYDDKFYSERSDGSRVSAELIVPLVLKRYPAVSVIDVGCGTGTWLTVFSACGVTDIHGVDGDHVDRSHLEIPASAFIAADLRKPLLLSRRFDLAVCLEVAEHLPEINALELVKSLTKIADVVLFSAAPPGQGGTNHINEQWPEYWSRLFEVQDFRAADCIRPMIWDQPQVDWWYAQNSIIYASNAAIRLNPELMRGSICHDLPCPMSFVHPRSFTPTRNMLTAMLEHHCTLGVLWCARAMTLSISAAIMKRIPWIAKRVR